MFIFTKRNKIKRILINSFLFVVVFYVFYSSGKLDSGILQTLIREDNLTDSVLTSNDSLWNRVYDPSRLIIVQKCIEVTGIVWDTPAKEGDADYHILIRLDSSQNYFLNNKNYELKDSCLVVEVVCAVQDAKHKGKVKTTLFYRLLYNDLPGVCDNYYNSIYIPKKGEHVRVKGPLIIDEGEYGFVEHGWQEIHPVNSIEIIN